LLVLRPGAGFHEERIWPQWAMSVRDDGGKRCCSSVV
jgi:hypothetical protein